MKAKKSLGQNFLIDEKIITNINNCIDASANDLIIEIGPGMGALTKKIQEKEVPIICYEIDKDLKPYLNSIVNSKTKIIYKDILKSNIKQDIEDIKYQNLYIVGNLPYYITTPIIKYLINQELDIKEMLFMVQDEVAERFSAKPNSKEYSSITLYLQYYYHINKLFKVSKYSFKPVPKVESAIIKFNKRQTLPNVNKVQYFNLINAAFKMKRKTLKNNLKDYDFAKVLRVLEKHNLNEFVRAEEISEEIFIEIANNLL